MREKNVYEGVSVEQANIELEDIDMTGLQIHYFWYIILKKYEGQKK